MQSSDALTPDPLLGQTVDGRYRIDAVLGEGGMGIVYLASHTTLGKPMALKLLRGNMAKDEVVVKRFMQEAQSSTQIGHPHIIDIHDFGKLADGSAYFVMEHLDGEPLTALIKRGRLPVQEILPLADQIASALSAAHQRGIVHRDVKPDNVYLIRRGGSDRFVKVLDFGVAKVGSSDAKLTKTGMVFGTPHYMSPEQAAGQPVDARSDIYALGVIIFEMCTGRVPFDGDTFMGILSQHMFDDPPRPTEIEREAGPLEPIILRALAKKPEDRYSSMDEVMADLATLRSGGAVLLKRGIQPPVMKPGRRESIPSSKMPLMVLAVLALVLLGGGIGGAWYAVRSADARQARSVAQTDQASDDVVPIEQPIEPVEVTPRGMHPPELQRVALDTHPSGAVVSVEGAVIGNTPIDLERPATGEQQVRIQMRGYESREIQISSTGGDTLSVTLRPARTVELPSPAMQAGTAMTGTAMTGTAMTGTAMTGTASQTGTASMMAVPVVTMSVSTMVDPGPAMMSEVVDPWDR